MVTLAVLHDYGTVTLSRNLTAYITAYPNTATGVDKIFKKNLQLVMTIYLLRSIAYVSRWGAVLVQWYKSV